MLGVLLWQHHCLPSPCWASLPAPPCLWGLELAAACLHGGTRQDSLVFTKYSDTWMKESYKCSVSLFEDPDQRPKRSLALPLYVHLKETPKWRSSSKNNDSKNNNECMKKKFTAVQLEHNETRKNKKQPFFFFERGCFFFFSDTLYPLVADF